LGPEVKPKLNVNPIRIGKPTKTKTIRRGGRDIAKPSREGPPLFLAKNLLLLGELIDVTSDSKNQNYLPGTVEAHLLLRSFAFALRYPGRRFWISTPLNAAVAVGSSLLNGITGKPLRVPLTIKF
jgi:hypothetical protein